jgi:hypothetical protein
MGGVEEDDFLRTLKSDFDFEKSLRGIFLLSAR